MSEPDKPAVAEVAAAGSGTGHVEGTGGEDVTEKSAKEENETKPIDKHEEGRQEKKEEDVKMEDAADKEGTVEEESKIGKEVEKEEPMKENVEEENKEHKNGDAIEENDEEAMNKGEEAEEKGNVGEEKTDEIEEKGMKKKRGRRKKLSIHEFEEKEEKIIKKRGRKTKEVLSTPIASSVDRPIRERRTVERLVETLQKEQPSKALLIEKGRGTPLKDIPNVAYKLSKKKPGDIRSLHQLLFGRKGKATRYKSHISQFSGFVWHENEEKQRAKVKEKLDKCVKDELLDFCDVFDIPGSRATSRKEELIEKLLDFMVAPRATTDAILAEKEQSSKSWKRKSRGRASRTAVTPRKYLRKKQTKGEDTEKLEKREHETEDEDGDEDENEEGDNEDDLPDEDDAIEHSEDEENESEHDDLEEYSHKGRRNPKSKRRGSSSRASKKPVTPEKVLPAATAKNPTRTSSKRKADVDKNANEKAFLKKKKQDVTPRKKISSPKPDRKEKKTTGKRAGRGKEKSDQGAGSGPTEEDLRKTICGILKEVDFNTATFTDILKKLASHYNMDLTARKASIKLMIQDELTKLADEAEDEDDGNEDESDKDGDPEPAGKKVEA